MNIILSIIPARALQVLWGHERNGDSDAEIPTTSLWVHMRYVGAYVLSGWVRQPTMPMRRTGQTREAMRPPNVHPTSGCAGPVSQSLVTGMCLSVAHLDQVLSMLMCLVVVGLGPYFSLGFCFLSVVD